MSNSKKAIKQSKADRVRALLNQGLSAAKIAKRTGISTAYVYVIKSAAKKAKRAKSVEKPESVKATDETAPETTPAQGESVSLEDGIDHLTGTLHILRMAKELLKGVTVTR